MNDNTGTFEKLGAFYLGREIDPGSSKPDGPAVLYDARDLTTHAVCVGMTGSGKTGLCVSLLEEAAIDGVPAIVIDPKGDLGNLLLTFPELQPADFRPWIDEDAARRKELSPDAFAAQQATLWRDGLAEWGQDGERIRRLKNAAEFAIYTPGSEAGRPVSVLSSLAAPAAAILSDGDAMRDRVAATSSSLLGLMGIDADPLRSREHILLSTILDHHWRSGTDVDLAGLIQALQSPPVQRIGVMELETFFPEKDRFALAMQLNGLLAAPGFATWMTGSPLDPQQLLYTPEGRPRIAIFSIAHLSEQERMFFVSLLLSEVLAWVRGCSGTTSLRALLYMDEIFGYLPPTAEPPSKRPLLTLLKQARAYGLGVVLATQNPVDLDYKALSNTGTWFLGRLQTERDRLRVLDGLEGAGGGWDRKQVERTLAGLGKRRFLLHNVHEERPVLFQTRWAMSYLRGPLTRDQIRKVSAGDAAAGPVSAAVSAAAGANAGASAGANAAAGAAARGGAAAATPPASGTPRAQAAPRPMLPSSIRQAFLPASRDSTVYRPALIGMGRVQFVERKSGNTLTASEIGLLVPLGPSDPDVDWSSAGEVDLVPEDLETTPADEMGFSALPPAAGKAGSYAKWRKQFADALYRGRRLQLWKSPATGLVSLAGESEGEFRIRLADAGREQRDAAADKLKERYGRRLARLEERLHRARQKIEREQEQASSTKVQTAISLGTTVLSALLGRRRVTQGTIGRASTTLRGAGRAARDREDVRRAREDEGRIQDELRELEGEFESELDALEDRLDPRTEELESIAIRPRRTDIDVRFVALTWVPDDFEFGPR